MKSHPETPEPRPESELANALLRWYRASARDLPWRRTRDPYAIWVSEVMLQQTRVDVVRPYYARFLQRFPTIADLAQATEEEVLASWSGLGYYTRARSLHRGAHLVLERFGGEFPRTWADTRAVPGIGTYTAAAVLSIAYDLPHAVVDGNVARVLARLFRIDPPGDRRPTLLQAQADALLDRTAPGDHNQAMMELGATICLPRNPRCLLCPVASHCRARRDDVVDSYPSPPRPVEVVRVDAVLLLLEHPQRGILLEKGRWPLLPHLWLPPIVPREGDPGAGHGAESWAAERGITLPPLRPVGAFAHAITTRRIRFEILEGQLARSPRDRADLRCFLPPELNGLGRSSIVTKALRLRTQAATRRTRKYGASR